MISPAHQSREERLREERTLGRAGLLAALAPLVVPTLLEIAERSADEAGHDPLPGLLPIAILIAAMLLDASLMLARNPTRGRALLAIGGFAFAVLATVGLREHPAQALALLLATMLFGSWIYFAPEAGEGHKIRNSKVARAKMAAIASIISPFLLVGFRMSDSPYAVPVQIVSVLIALALGFRAMRRIRLRSIDLGIVVGTVLSCGLMVLVRDHADLAIFALTPVSISLVASLRTRMIRDPLEDVGWIDLLLDQPARLMVGTFLVTGLAGGVALSLPICSTDGRVLLLDATFTAFSAVCVTGLTVIDTATAYSQFGQGVIMTLIQIGGLGIMAFSTAAMVLLGQRMTMKHEGAAIELLGGGDRRTGIHTALRRVLIVTGVSELIGALALTVLFWQHGDGWAEAIWRGTFTSISAYCNAGFALQSDNLVTYQSDPLVLHVVALLIIVGGLGPAVVIATPGSVLRWRRAPLHTQIVVLTTAVLLVVPAFLIAGLEWNYSLSELGTADRLHNAWFQSVTTRTAGFNSVDFAAMTPATVTLVEGLMFVGGSPGSTAGGIKTTTLFVLVLSVVAVTRNQTVVIWSGWTIPHSTVYRAAAVVTLGAATVVFGVFAILLTQELDTQTALFEVISALATVGLSTGGTGQLDSVGKQIIITCMLIGRVAPLTLFLMFNRPVRRAGKWTFPEQDVSVG